MTSMLDAPPAGSGSASLAALFGTVGVHGAIIAGFSLLGVHGVVGLSKVLPATEMVEVELPATPPPPAPAAEAAAPRSAPVRQKAPATPAEEPPPAAAQAGQILDAKSEVVDFGDNFVTGSGEAYAGGVTDAKGTSKVAVQERSAQGDGAGRGRAPAPPPVADLSRAPRLAGGAQWSCPFPGEADDAGIDHAVVTLRVDVAADGSVRNVTTVADPGNGFGREARRCATGKRWSAGLDREGRAIQAVAIVNVRFDR